MGKEAGAELPRRQAGKSPDARKAFMVDTVGGVDI